MLFINKKKLTKSEINLKLLNKYKVNINELNYDKLKEFKEKVKALSDGRQKGLLKMDMIKIMFKLIIVRIVLKNFHIFILPNNLGHNWNIKATFNYDEKINHKHLYCSF